MECYFLPWTNCTYEQIFGTATPSYEQVRSAGQLCIQLDLIIMPHELSGREVKAMLQRLIVGHLATLDLDPVDPATSLLLLVQWAHVVDTRLPIL